MTSMIMAHAHCTGAIAAVLAVGVVLAAWLSTSRRSGPYQELRGRVRPGVLAWASSRFCYDFQRCGDFVARPLHCLKRDQWGLSAGRFEQSGYLIMEMQSLIVSCGRRICKNQRLSSAISNMLTWWIMLYPRAAQVAS